MQRHNNRIILEGSEYLCNDLKQHYYGRNLVSTQRHNKSIVAELLNCHGSISLYPRIITFSTLKPARQIFIVKKTNYYLKTEGAKIFKAFKGVWRKVKIGTFEMKALICDSNANTFFLHVLQARETLFHTCYPSFSGNNTVSTLSLKSRLFLVENRPFSGDVRTCLPMMVPLRGMRLNYSVVLTSLLPALLN
jgi:hypothetical protein